jgi:hypothetical protein
MSISAHATDTNSFCIFDTQKKAWTALVVSFQGHLSMKDNIFVLCTLFFAVLLSTQTKLIITLAGIWVFLHVIFLQDPDAKSCRKNPPVLRPVPVPIERPAFFCTPSSHGSAALSHYTPLQ